MASVGCRFHPEDDEKRSEPQDRQRDATSPRILASNGVEACASRPIGGVNRRDRENRCGRNGIGRLAPPDRSDGSNVGAGVDAGDEVDGGAEWSG